MSKRIFDRETLLSKLCGKDCVRDLILDTSRWSVYHELIFRHENKLYVTTYSCGATELQDESPWEYDGDEIECAEVEEYERTVIDYREID